MQVNSTCFKPKVNVQFLSPDYDTFKHKYDDINNSPGQDRGKKTTLPFCCETFASLDHIWKHWFFVAMLPQEFKPPVVSEEKMVF